MLVTRSLVFGLALATVASAGVAAETLKVSQDAQDNYDEYLRKLGMGNDNVGAFAVSPDGRYSYYIYCSSEECSMAQAGADATSECKSLSGQDCRLVGVNHDLRIDMEVDPAIKCGCEE